MSCPYDKSETRPQRKQMCCNEIVQQIRGNKTDENTTEEMARVAAALEKKVPTLTELNEKILEDVPDEKIKTEIVKTDEYMFNLILEIHQIQKLVNSRRSIWNVKTSALNHNVSSNSTSSGVDVTTQPPVQDRKHCVPKTRNHLPSSKYRAL